MTYHLKLTKALSYCGVVTATREKPDVYTDDGDVADKAVATGYFELVGSEVSETPPEGSLQEDEIDATKLGSMSLAELKDLAKQLGADLTGRKSKEDIIEAICVANGGSQTMIDLQQE